MAKKKLEIKSWKESRTVIFNLLAIVVLVAEMLLRDVVGLPMWANEALMGLVTVGNIALRFRTTEAIK